MVTPRCRSQLKGQKVSTSGASAGHKVRSVPHRNMEAAPDCQDEGRVEPEGKTSYFLTYGHESRGVTDSLRSQLQDLSVELLFLHV